MDFRLGYADNFLDGYVQGILDFVLVHAGIVLWQIYVVQMSVLYASVTTSGESGNPHQLPPSLCSATNQLYITSLRLHAED
jgi:hypothetical protein